MFNTKNRGFGFGKMPGFNRAKKGTISNGDFDRDGVKNKKDCDAFNFRKQGPDHPDYELIEDEVSTGKFGKRTWEHEKTGKIVKEKYNEKTGFYDVQ